MELSNIKLQLSYEGTSFLGWQETNEGPSIEGELKKALETLLQEPVQLQAASRTDQGVHALGQVVNFFTRSPLSNLRKRLNALLPQEIRVLEVDSVPLSFHPTLDAIGKEYTYTLFINDVHLPFFRLTSCHVLPPFDREALEKGAAYFVGTHDFSSFCNARKNLVYPDKVRTIFYIRVEPLSPSILQIHVAGNHFLYKMARNICGTLIQVGKGKILPSEIPQILEGKKRALAGITAPAHGLTLTKIFYPGKEQ